MLTSERTLAMGIQTKHDTLCIKKVLRFSIRISYRCASEHWVLFSLVLLIYLLHKHSPGFFAFLLSSSPVIICTTLLLGMLLSYGSTHLHDADENGKTTTDVSAPKFDFFSGNSHFQAHHGLSVHAFNENRINFNRTFRNTSFSKVELGDNVPLLKVVDKGDEKLGAHDSLEGSLISSPSIMKLDREASIEKFLKANHEENSKDHFTSNDKGNKYANMFEVAHQSRVDEKETAFGLCSTSENHKEDSETVVKENQERVLTDSQSGQVRGVPEDMIAQKPAGTCRWGRAFSMRQRKKLDNIKIEAINTAVGNRSDSSISSPLGGILSHDGSSSFVSYKAKNSSFDAPMTDLLLDEIAPLSSDEFASPDLIANDDKAKSSSFDAPMTDVVLDEIAPLSSDEFASSDPIANDDSGGDSKLCPQDSQVNNGGNDEADSELDKEDGGSEPALLWIADNEKNVMDIGYCEMERNRRLEIMMVKRRSSKNIILDIDRTMMDLDGDDVCQNADEYSRFPIKFRPISVPRRNLFAFSSDSDDAAAPGSAPSVMHGRKNPFEPPFEQLNDGVHAHDKLEPQEFVTGSHRDMLFRRHGTFNFGSQDRRLSRFKPCFVLEAMEIEDASTIDFQRQFSEKSMSRLSIITESDTTSSVVDPEDLNEFIKKDFVWDLQRQLSGKSVSKLSVVSESDAVSSVPNQEDRNDLLQKDFLWYFQRQFSDKSVAKRSIFTESDTVSSVADQDECNDIDLGYVGNQRSGMINFLDDITLNTVTSALECEQVENTAT